MYRLMICVFRVATINHYRMTQPNKENLMKNKWLVRVENTIDGAGCDSGSWLKLFALFSSFFLNSSKTVEKLKNYFLSIN